MRTCTLCDKAVKRPSCLHEWTFDGERAASRPLPRLSAARNKMRTRLFGYIRHLPLLSQQFLQPDKEVLCPGQNIFLVPDLYPTFGDT